MDKEELRQKLLSRLSEMKISRSGKKVKKAVLEDTLKTVGIDVEEFKKNLEIVSKAQKQKSL